MNYEQNTFHYTPLQTNRNQQVSILNPMTDRQSHHNDTINLLSSTKRMQFKKQFEDKRLKKIQASPLRVKRSSLLPQIKSNSLLKD